ncbi:hypothetical protein GCM10010187_38350 [Actinomadura coerulea]|nr:hypothetical protein GCM10010187_38350 [Actinomadura coerulea]
MRRTLRAPERPRGAGRLRGVVGPPAGGGTDMTGATETGAATDLSRLSAIAMRSPPVRLAVSPN